MGPGVPDAQPVEAVQAREMATAISLKKGYGVNHHKYPQAGYHVSKKKTGKKRLPTNFQQRVEVFRHAASRQALVFMDPFDKSNDKPGRALTRGEPQIKDLGGGYLPLDLIRSRTFSILQLTISLLSYFSKTSR